jgi:uncharacterized alpha-E superfamily protein
MISRVADHGFWFGRYLERAESTARVLHVTLTMALDAELTKAQCWLPVIIVSGEKAHFASTHEPGAEADGDLVQRYMSWSEDNMTSIRRSVSAARENARSIREVVSLEAWETVNRLYLWIESPEAREEYEVHRYGFYRRVREEVQLCLGLLRSTMLHDTPLDFIWLGVLLERVGQTARVLDVHHHAVAQYHREQAPNGEPFGAKEVETAIWLSLLRACSGFEPFMKQSPGRVSGSAVAAFLILEPKFPRSIRYCIDSSYDRFCAIRPIDQHALPGAETLRRFGALHDWIRGRTAESLAAGSIHELLTHVVDETARICDGIARELFGYGAEAVSTQEQQQS